MATALGEKEKQEKKKTIKILKIVVYISLLRPKEMLISLENKGSHQKNNPVELGTLSQVACHPPTLVRLGHI